MTIVPLSLKKIKIMATLSSTSVHVLKNASSKKQQIYLYLLRLWDGVTVILDVAECSY